jgi:hypothetical protein
MFIIEPAILDHGMAAFMVKKGPVDIDHLLPLQDRYRRPSPTSMLHYHEDVDLPENSIVRSTICQASSSFDVACADKDASCRQVGYLIESLFPPVMQIFVYRNETPPIAPIPVPPPVMRLLCHANPFLVSLVDSRKNNYSQKNANQSVLLW